MYGVSYGGYKVWSLIYRVQCIQTLIEGTMYGDLCRGYKEWRLIERVNCT